MKRKLQDRVYIACSILLFLTTALTSKKLSAQANDWYFPPDIRLDMNGGGFSNFTWGSDITSCGTANSQQGVLSTNSGGTNYRAFNHCSIYDFNGTNINPSWQGADILFTVPGLCNQYWEVSWKYVWGPPHSLKLSITKYNAPDPSMMEWIEEEDLTISDDVPEGTCGPTGSWDVAVAPLANDGSRTIYAVSGSGLVSWTIDANGNVSYNGLLATLPHAVDHQVRMEVTSDGKHVIMNPCGYQGVMIYDLYPLHGAPNVRLISVGKYIAGYEYVPANITGSNERLYVSSHNATAPYAGGITYYDFNTGSGPTVPFTYGSQQVFGFTEIELGKDGLLYFAYNPNFGSGFVGGAGDLYYFNPASASTASPMLSAYGGGEVSTYFNWGYYIQRQIDGENYDVTDYSMPQPQFNINGKIQPNPFNVNDIWYCSNKLNLNTTITGYHTYYTVKVDTGTITTGMFGIKFFNQVGSSFPLLTINNSNTQHALDLVAYMPRLGKYNGSIRVTVTAYGCGSAPSIQMFNLKNPISGLMLAIAANPCNNGKVNGIRVDQLPIADQIFTSTPCMDGWVGAQTGGVTNPAFAGTGTVTNVTQTIDDVDPNTGAFIANIGSISSPTIPNTNTSFATIVQSANPGYFIMNYMSAIYKTYRYTLAVTEDGCTATDTIYFRIARDANPYYLGPSTWWRVGNTEDEDQNNRDGLMMYPNPATDYIRIESDDITDESIVIISDNAGRVVFKQTGLVSANKQINLHTLSSGVYYYTVITDGNTYNGKFVKQ